MQPDLGDDDRRGDAAGAGDLVQSFRRVRERGDHLLDPLVEPGDVGVQAVDAGEHPGSKNA